MSHNRKSKDNIVSTEITEEVLKTMKERDVNIASWLISLLTIAVGSVKVFTEEYFDIFEHFGKNLLLDTSILGFLMVIFGVLFLLSLFKKNIKIGKLSISRISIIFITCLWTYLAFEYLMITIFINTGIVWIMAIGIVAICFYIMVRGDYD